MMLKQSRHSGLQSYISYALVAPERLKHLASTYVKPELSLIFCQSQARTRPENPCQTYHSRFILC